MSVYPKKIAGNMEGDKISESLPGISKPKGANKKVKSTPAGRGKNSAEVDARPEEVDQAGMKNMEVPKTGTARTRHARNACSQPILEVDLDPRPAGVETGSLENQVGLNILHKISNLTTAVEGMNTKMTQIVSEVDKVKAKVSSMKDDLKDHIEKFTTFDLDTTSDIRKLKELHKDIKERVVQEFNLQSSEIVGTRDALDTRISTAVGEIKQSIAAQPQGNQVVMMANSGGASSSTGNANVEGPALVEAPTTYCSVTIKGTTYNLNLNETELSKIGGALKEREVVRNVLLHYYAPKKLRPMTLRGSGKANEDRPIIPTWLVALCQQALLTAFPIPGVPAGCQPRGALSAELMKDVKRREKETRTHITDICQYYRDILDKDGNKKGTKKKPPKRKLTDGETAEDVPAHNSARNLPKDVGKDARDDSAEESSDGSDSQ